MADKTKIEWTDSTWNPITGCTPCSPGCDHCYARRMAERFPQVHGGEFAHVKFHPDRLQQPLHWRKPRRIFVCSMGDLFHPDVPFGWVMRVLRVMAHCPRHTFILLTKRPQRMLDFWQRWGDLSGEDYSAFHNARGPVETRKAHPSPRGQLFADMLETMGEPPQGCAFPTFDWMDGMQGWPTWLSNVWLGVTVCNQAEADAKIPVLLSTPAALRFVSIEPMLGPVDLALWLPWGKHDDAAKLDWVICGGETGPGARRMDGPWVRALRDQCVSAGVPFFFKGWGTYLTPKTHPTYRWLDGRKWQEFPRGKEV